jgi:hypothetical protein
LQLDSISADGGQGWGLSKALYCSYYTQLMSCCTPSLHTTLAGGPDSWPRSFVRRLVLVPGTINPFRRQFVMQGDIFPENKRKFNCTIDCMHTLIAAVH